MAISSWERKIKNYVSYLKIEKGLAENSILAYQSDIQKLKEFAQPLNVVPEDISLSHLKEFLTDLYELGLSARSQARIVSGIKQFYQFFTIRR